MAPRYLYTGMVSISVSYRLLTGCEFNHREVTMHKRRNRGEKNGKEVKKYIYLCKRFGAYIVVTVLAP